MYNIPYEITALVARYILILLCALVLVRAIFISRASKMASKHDIEVKIAKLVMIDTAREYILGYDNTIGKSNRCDVQIYGQGAAKIHAQIYKKKEKWILCTYSNKNTLLNEIKISGRIEINSHDILKFGNKDYRFISTKGDRL